MPEGPEIRREADEIGAALAGRELERLQFALPRLKPLERRLKGAMVRSVDPHGKALLIRFDNGLTLYTHNQLYGRWYVVPAGELPRTKRSLRVALETSTQAALLYSASQIALLDEAELSTHPYLAKLGPDLLDPTLKLATLAKRLLDPRFRTKRIAALLLDQAFLAGSGNYLRSEILFEAKLHPLRRADSLTPLERRRFARAAIRIGVRAYRLKGVTNEPRRVARLRKLGKTRRAYRFAVFNRQSQPCYVCATPIVRELISGRRLYRCPTCQPLPPHAAPKVSPRILPQKRDRTGTRLSRPDPD